MGISFQTIHHPTTLTMKSFVAFVALLAVANGAGVSSHASVKHGHSAGYSHAVAHAPAYHAAPVYKVAPVYHAAPAYHAPIYHAAPAYHAPSYKEPVYADVEAKYQYGYGADDDVSGVHIAASESRDGYATSGEYRVALPDCRTQIVKYNTADGYSGNVVEVTYEGTPCEAKAPAYFAPAPAYRLAPAPAYRAAPAPATTTTTTPAPAPAPAYKAAPAPSYSA